MIEKLSHDVVNRIAAGEVVERPSHLVKELVENSIDAGATSIEIDFSEGGRCVDVRDNGQGIEATELPLALSRHATSKIRKSEDLWSLSSFGFRGEALAAIAAISKLQLTSRPAQADQAARVEAQFGRLSETYTSSGIPGTHLYVSDLFANVPARLKFLKSESAEHSQIKQMLKALALAHPHIHFKVKQRGEMIHLWSPAKSLQDRAIQVLDQKELYVSQGVHDGYEAEVVFSPPHHTVKTGRQIFLFVQNRWVQDRSLVAAIMEAYRNLLMHREFPSVVVKLQVPPTEVDVNIHPTKSQVKFRNGAQAFRAVQRTLRGALEQAPWLEERLPKEPHEAAELKLQFQEKQPQTQTFTDRLFEKVQYPKKNFLPSARLSLQQIADFGPQTSSQEAVSDSRIHSWAHLQVIGQAHLTYIVTQTEQALVFIDQHAAHERVLFERLMHAWQKGEAFEVQQLLLPLSMDLDEAKVEKLLGFDKAKSLGIIWERLGPETLGITSMPAQIRESALLKAVEQLAEQLLDHGESFEIEKSMGEICATMSCHSAIRAGKAMSLEEMQGLLEQMDEYPLSSFCPHGRPVFVEYPFTKLEKDFGRLL